MFSLAECISLFDWNILKSNLDWRIEGFVGVLYSPLAWVVPTTFESSFIMRLSNESRFGIVGVCVCERVCTAVQSKIGEWIALFILSQRILITFRTNVWKKFFEEAFDQLIFYLHKNIFVCELWRIPPPHTEESIWFSKFELKMFIWIVETLNNSTLFLVFFTRMKCVGIMRLLLH